MSLVVQSFLKSWAQLSQSKCNLIWRKRDLISRWIATLGREMNIQITVHDLELLYRYFY